MATIADKGFKKLIEETAKLFSESVRSSQAGKPKSSFELWSELASIAESVVKPHGIARLFEMDSALSSLPISPRDERMTVAEAVRSALVAKIVRENAELAKRVTALQYEGKLLASVTELMNEALFVVESTSVDKAVVREVIRKPLDTLAAGNVPSDLDNFLGYFRHTRDLVIQRLSPDDGHCIHPEMVGNLQKLIGRFDEIIHLYNEDRDWFKNILTADLANRSAIKADPNPPQEVLNDR